MRRLLLSIVGSAYGGAFAGHPLEFTPQLGQRLIASLRQHGYEADPPAGHLDLDARTIGDVVAESIHSAGPDDLLIVHVLGHGVVNSESVMIVGSDGETRGSTNVNSWIVDATGRDEVQDPERRSEPAEAKAKVLFLVDVCHAGLAARLSSDGGIDDERRRAWVIAGCLPTQAGYNGHLTEALADVLADLGRIDQHYSYEYVPLASVVRAVRQRVVDLAHLHGTYPQVVVATRADIGAVVDVPFFVNPAYQPSLLGGVPPELREVVEAVDTLVDPWHFVARASGRHQSTGRISMGTFQGRGAQLRRMTEWITGERQGVLMVVTGSPGVGKSATIGMLVCASHPALATATDRLWWDRRADLPAAPLPAVAVVHARERTAGEILGSLALQLDLPHCASPDELSEGLRRRESPPVLIIDALDESIDPAAVVAAVTALSGVCRLLVGTRAGQHWPAFQPLCTQADELGTLVDLDTEDRDVLRGNLNRYVDDLLRSDTRYNRHAMVGTRRHVVEHVAEVLAAPITQEGEPHWGEFLVAGVYVNHLLRLPVPDDDTAARRLSVPRTLPEVLDLDLAARESPWLLPVLEVVAHAFGAGVPAEVIEACCADPELTGAAVREALRQARFYLRRDHEPDGTTLYRLFHQALSDHLQRRAADRLGGPTTVHGRIVDAAVRTIHDQGPRNGWDGTITAPYLLRHAADHAAACGRIDELLTDARFLVHADATYLSRHLRRATSPDARAAAAVLRSSLHHHLRLGAHARRSLLAVDATRRSQVGLRREILAVAGDLPAMTWRPTWSSGGQSGSLLHVLAAGSEVTAIALVEAADGRPMAAVGTQPGNLILWDLVDGTQLAARATDGTPVLHVLPSPDGTTVLTVSASGSVRRWSLPGGFETERTDLSAPGSTVVTHLRVPNDSDYIVTGDRAGRLRCATVDAGPQWSAQAHTAEISAITATLLADGTPVLVSGDRHGEIRVRELATGVIHTQLPDRLTWVGGIACHRLHDGRDVAAITGGDGTVSVWDLSTGDLVNQFDTAQGWLAPPVCVPLAASVQDVVIVAGERGVADAWDIADGRKMWHQQRHRSWQGAPTCITLNDRSLVVVTVGGDGTARLCDPATGVVRDTLCGHNDSVVCSAHLRTADGGDLLVTADLDGQLRVWDLDSPPGPNVPHMMREWNLSEDLSRVDLNVGHLDTVTAVAAEEGRYPIVISAGRDGSVIRWEALTGDVMEVVHAAENPVMAVAAGGDGHIVSGDLAGILRHSRRAADGTYQGVTVETLEPAIVAIACPRGRHEPFQAVVAASWGARTAVWPGPDEDFVIRPASGITVTALAWLHLADGTPVVVTGAVDSTAAIWLAGTSELCHELYGHRDEITAVAGLNGPDGLVVTGAKDAEVRCWHLENGDLQVTLRGHTARITAVACHRTESGVNVAAAAQDGTVRIWRLEEPGICEVIMLPEPCASLTFTSDGGLAVGYGWEVARFDPAAQDADSSPPADQGAS